MSRYQGHILPTGSCFAVLNVPVEAVSVAVDTYCPTLGEQFELGSKVVFEAAVFDAADMVVADVQETSYIIGYTADTVVFETLAGYFHGEI